MRSVPPFPHVVCWDSHIRTQITGAAVAELPSAFFAAIHSHAPLTAIGPNGVTTRSESSFLAELLAPERRHFFSFVVGERGSGKAHFIRWLELELLRLNAEREHRWHIVHFQSLITGSSEAVEKIVWGIDGPHVQSLLSPPAPALEAFMDFGGTLNKLAAALANETPHGTGGQTLSEDEKEIRRMLPAFLHDDAIREWLHAGGTWEDVSSPDQSAWRPERLEVPPQVYRKTGSAAQEIAGLLMSDPGVRQMASRLLDEARGEPRPVAPEPQRIDVRQALLAVRQDLYSQGRQLVVLVENLSLLAGVRDELLSALLLPPDGEPDSPLSAVRSVVGVDPETMATLSGEIVARADRTLKFGFAVTAGAGPTENAGDFLADFISRYLNAIRYSREDLQAWYDAGRTGGRPLPSFCETSACPNRPECHGAFGAVSPDGATSPYGMYPFTRETLLRLHERLDEPIAAEGMFNPERSLREVFVPVLEAAERSVPAGEFPPQDLLDRFWLEHDVRADAGRMSRALTLYTPDQPTLPQGIAAALGLPAGAQPEVVAYAVALLALGAALRGAGFHDEESLLSAALTDWPAGEALPHYPPALRQLWETFQNRAPGLTSWLNQQLSRKFADLEETRRALEQFLADGQIPPQHVAAEQWPREIGLHELAYDARRLLPLGLPTDARDFLRRFGDGYPLGELLAKPGLIEWLQAMGFLESLAVRSV
jgi:hypothetical protein